MSDQEPFPEPHVHDQDVILYTGGLRALQNSLKTHGAVVRMIYRMVSMDAKQIRFRYERTDSTSDSLDKPAGDS